MSERISCPCCRRALPLPHDGTDTWLTCPGCLARIRNPRALAITSEAEKVSEKRDRSCPSCGAGAEAYWLFCPHCEQPLRDPRRPAGGDGYLDVSQKDGGLERFIGFLAMLGLVGIAIPIMGSVLALPEGNEAPQAVTLAVLWVFMSVSAAVVLARGGRSRKSTASRLFVGILSLVGILVAGGCLVAVARFLFLLAVWFVA